MLISNVTVLSIPNNLSQLGDVSVNPLTLAANRNLRYNGTKWTDTAATLANETDVQISAIKNNDGLVWSSTLNKFVNVPIDYGLGSYYFDATKLQHFDHGRLYRCRWRWWRRRK